MKKYLILLFIPLFCLLLFVNNINSAYAWGPISHCGMISKAIDQCGKSTIAYQLITSQDKWFWEGMQFPDITVLHYYTTFTTYSNTHSWGFYEKLWAEASVKGSNQAMAFALGVGTHLIQDSIVHNLYIPAKIRQYFTQNAIVHPLVEAQIEGKFTTQGDDWYSLAAIDKAQNSFVKILEDKFTDSADLATYNPAQFAIRWGLGINEGTSDWNIYLNDTATFKDILYGGSFYSEKGYGTSGELWGIYKAGGAFLKNFIDTSDIQKYYNMTVDQTVAWYNSNDYKKEPKAFIPTAEDDPTGINSINAANSYVMMWYIFGFICFGVIVVLWSYRRKIIPQRKFKLNGI